MLGFRTSLSRQAPLVDFHAKLTQGFHPKLTHPWLSKFSYCFVDKSFISVLGSPVLWVLVFVRRVRGAAELCLKRQESLPVSTIWQ